MSSIQVAPVAPIRQPLCALLSLVQAVGSTTTLFVFAVGVILSIFFPALGREDLSPP
jgi:hypothetical protein